MSLISRIRIGACFLASSALFAGPPYLTDDPDPVGFRHWENYLFSQAQWTRGARSGFFPGFEANYGPFTNAQIQFQMPYVRETGSDGMRVQGFGDLQVGFKYRFVDEGDSQPQFAIYPQVQAPTASDKEGLGGGHWRVYVPLLMQKSFGSWTTYGGGGWWRNPGPGNLNYWTYGWQIQREFGEKGSLGFEIFHQGASRVGEGSTTSYNFGFQKPLSRRLQVIGSLGRMFRGETGNQCYLGLKGTF